MIRSPSGGRPRGQTALDFTIGVSVFLVVMVFVFSFVPGVLGPFVSTGGDHPALADRLADRLAQGGLGDPEEPFVLDRDCTVEFFNGSRYDDGLGSPGECRYDGNAFEERLAIDDGPNINVTLSGNASAGIDGATTLCWDESGGDLVQVETAACDGDDVRLTAGGIPPRDNDTTYRVRPLIQRLDGERRLVYEAGAVFRTTRQSGVLFREPPVLSRDGSVHITVPATRATAGNSLGGGTALVRGEVTDRDVPVSDTDDTYTTVVYNVTSPRADLWHDHLETEGFDCSDPADGTTECQRDSFSRLYVSVQEIELSLVR